MAPPSDPDRHLSPRQTRLWGFALLGLILLGLLISWGLPALLETRLPPNLRQGARPSANPDRIAEADTKFVIVADGNPEAEALSEDPLSEASGSPDSISDTPLAEPEDSAEAASDAPPRNDTPVRDTLQPPRLTSRPANTEPPPMQSLPSQRQLVEPPDLPPRSGKITQNTQQPAAPALPKSPVSSAPRPAGEKPPPAGSLRIWVGPFGGREQAQTASEKLSAAGHANQLITEGGSFRLRLNQAAANPDEALDLADAVALLGFEITVRKSD